MPTSARHETRALLRAHLSAAVGYRHRTQQCPVCHQLQRLAMEPAPPAGPARWKGREPTSENDGDRGDGRDDDRDGDESRGETNRPLPQG